jgi:outer membrane protein assembly factor BamA
MWYVFLLPLQAQKLIMEEVDPPPDGWLYHQDTTPAKWIRELKNIILISPKPKSDKDTFNVVSYNAQHLAMEGRTITRIRYIGLKPFGTDINAVQTDVHSPNLSFLEKAGNALHSQTREFVIRNALYFQEGDTIDAMELADSERYLRSLRYISDARITALPTGEGEAEIVVLTQDVFPFSVDAGSNFRSKGNFAISDRNVLGLGFNLQAGMFFNAQREHRFGYEVTANIHNINRSHISLDVIHYDRFNNRKTGIVINRDFYTTSTKYAGNLTAYREQKEINYASPDSSSAYLVPIRLQHYDAWAGRSFLLSSSSGTPKNLTVALRVQNIRFLLRPENAQNMYYQFQNRTVYLSAISFFSQSHYKSNMIYNYGRTEDIPHGYLFSLVAGKEYNERYNRPYAGFSADVGHFISSVGYLSESVSYGTFIHNRRTEQGLLDVGLNYFTNLLVTGRLKQRFFANVLFSTQLDNQLDDYLNIDGDLGIPGFRNDSIYGRRRINLSLEHIFFMPRSIYGFRIVCYLFSNMSWLGGYNQYFQKSALYSSFGFGIRIRNNRLIISTLQIQMSFFPHLPKNSKFSYVDISKETVLSPKKFTATAPEVKYPPSGNW